MKKQLSSIDLHYLIKELKYLEDSKIDKIYQPEKEKIIFSFYKTNVGKKLLNMHIGQSIFISDAKESTGETLGFGMFLRKHLDGYFLHKICQLEPERIIKFEFRIKDTTKFLFIEIFGKGNAILCDEHNVIINALEHHEFRERVVKPRLKYVYPVMNYNLFGIDKKQLGELFKNSKKENVVVSLATELGLGGVYSEEICLMSRVDKAKKPADIDNNEIEEILASLKKVLHRKIDAKVILENTKVLDFAPFEIEFYEEYAKKSFDSFSSAIAYFYSYFREEKATEFDRKLKNLQRIIEEQRAAIEQLRIEEKEYMEKGELIYHKYGLIKEILDELNKASNKYSWKEIKEKVKGHKIIKEFNEKNRKVVIEV